MPYNNDHTNVDSGDDSLPLIVDEADELEQRPGNTSDGRGDDTMLQVHAVCDSMYLVLLFVKLIYREANCCSPI